MISSELDNLSHDNVVHSEAPEGGYSVLLAEDDPALKRYLQIVLLRAGYNVFAASDGLEAMKLLLSHSFDVVVTDAVMPNLSGYELCRFVRSTERLSHLPLVLLSALDPKNAEADQVDTFLNKPISPEKLLECLEALVGSGRRGDGVNGTSPG
jgi:CheY-like chemotaxis protein